MAGGRQALANALQNFVFSLSQGLGASAQAPGARGTRLGMAAALGAPMQLQEILRQRSIQDEDRAQRAQQAQESLRLGKVNEALEIFKAMRNTTAPNVPTQIPQAPYMQERAPQFPGGPTPTQMAQPEGTRTVPMPGQLPAVNIPGFGPVVPESRQSLMAQDIDKMLMEARVRREGEPAFQAMPGGTGVLNRFTGTVSGQPSTDMRPMAQAVMQMPDVFKSLPAETKEKLLPILVQSGFKMPEEKSETALDLEAYLKHPELTAKFGNDRVGFRKWQDSMRSNDVLDAIRSLNLSSLSQAAPGQIVYRVNGKPVPPASVPETAARRLEGIETALQQADEVEKILLRLGDTGAISGYVLDTLRGTYWPVVQDNITPDQAAAVSETQRLLSGYAQTVSGLAVTDQEIQRLSRSAPSVRLVPGANKAIIGHFRRNAINQRENYLKARGWKYADDEGATGPKIGTIENGYMYIGGNPADPKSWKKQ